MRAPASGLRLRSAIAIIGLGLVACQREAAAPIAIPGLGVERLADTSGRYQTITRSVRNLLLTPGANGDSTVFSVLEERSVTRCCNRESEHPTATAISLSRVDRDPDGTTARPWTLDVSFDEGALWWESWSGTPYYRGTEWGCCDASDLQTLISAVTGTTVLHYSKEWEPGGEVPTQFLGGRDERRFFGFVEPYQMESRDPALQRSVFGLLEITDGTHAPWRWALRAPADAAYRFGSLRLVASGRPGPGERILSTQSFPEPRPQDLSGFDLLVYLPAYEGEDTTIRIPVRGGALNERAMIAPPGWRVERIQ